MLVVKRGSGQLTDIEVKPETIRELANQNLGANMSIRTYDINTDNNMKRDLSRLADRLQANNVEVANEIREILNKYNNKGYVNLAFNDPQRIFEINRRERVVSNEK